MNNILNFDIGLKTLLEGDLEKAHQAFLASVQGKEREADALFLGAVSLHLLERDNEAGALFARSAKAGPVSPDFFSILGQVIESLGARGEELHQYLQGQRRLPWQLVGQLAPDNQENVEPWYFAPSVVSAFPSKRAEFDDLQAIVENRILPGFLPRNPVFDRNSTLLTMGSCFAQELRNYLAEKGMRSDWLFVPPGLNNTFAVRNFVEWSLTGVKSSEAYWYDEAISGGAQKMDSRCRTGALP